jgi:hypothetical protein
VARRRNDDIGIFLTPSAVVRIEAVNAIEIRLPNTKVARLAKPAGERAAKGQAADAAAPTID